MSSNRGGHACATVARVCSRLTIAGESSIAAKTHEWGALQFTDSVGVRWRIFDYRVDALTCQKVRLPLGDARAQCCAFLR